MSLSSSLVEGEWFNTSIDEAWQSKYVKFEVPPTLAASCPIITLEIQTQIGEVALYVSAQTVPNLGKNDFARPAVGPSTLVICPTQPNFYYGTYYVNMQSSDYDTNIFAIRYTITPSPTCLATTAASISAHVTYPSAPNSIWLQDGIVSNIEVPANVLSTYRYFQIYTEGQCVDFSASAHSTEGTDMLASLYIIPNVITQANETSVMKTPTSWTIPHVPTASINFRYCNPDAAATHNIFYIGVKFGQTKVLNETEEGSVRHFQLVATAQQYTPAAPLTSFGYVQSKMDLSYGAAPTVTCGTRQSQCQRYAYTLCIADYIGCCDSYWPIPPEKNLQPYWPWNPADSTIDSNFYNEINWRGMQPLVEGKLAFAVYNHWRDPSGFNVVMPVGNATSCTVDLGGSLVNSAGDLPASSKILFAKDKPLTCDLKKYEEIDERLDTLTNKMLEPEIKTDINALALTQLELLLAAWDDEYYGCRLAMRSYLNMSVELVESKPGAFCTTLQGSDAWFADPCCNPQLWPFRRCAESVYTRVVNPDGLINVPKVEKQCANPTCSMIYLGNYIDDQHHLANERVGCVATIFKQANPALFKTAQTFAMGCQSIIDSQYTMTTSCLKDEDCYMSATCNMTTNTCNNTEDLLTMCLATDIPFDIAVGLFNNWGLEGNPNEDNLLNGTIRGYPGVPMTEMIEAPSATPHAYNYDDSILALKWMNDQCVGPTARRFRSGFHFARADPNCVDDCLLQGLEPFCIHHEASQVCPMPSMCDREANGSSSICARTWVKIERDLSGCLDDRVCNWRANESYPCRPLENQDECAAKCEDTSHSPQVCLDCSRSVMGTCLEIPEITTQSRCLQGVCTSNVSESSNCESTGVCTLPCGPESSIDPAVSPFYPDAYSGCSSQAACESSRRCSDYDLFAPLSATQSGICLKPLSWLGFYSYCEDGWKVKNWTCANFSPAVTEATCAGSAPGAYWYSLAQTEEECSTEGTAPYVCYWPMYSLWLARSEAECKADANTVWIPAFNWLAGNWTAGRLQPLLWQDRGMIQPNEVRHTYDYQLIATDVKAAIAQQFSYAYYTGALCRYGASTDQISTVICNCNTDGGASCFNAEDEDSFSNKPNGEVLVCPYQSKSLATQAAKINVPAGAMPTSTPCTILDIYSTPMGAFALPPDSGASRPLFREVDDNPFLVVVNRHNTIVGQLMSAAVIVSYNFTAQAELQLCVYFTNYTEAAKSATIYRLAKVQPDRSVRVVDDSRIELSVVERSNAYQLRALNASATLLCGYISEPGTYFGVAVIPDYQTKEDKLGAQSIAALIFYIALFFFAAIQLVLLLLDRERQRLLAFKIVALSIIMLTVIARVIAIQPNVIFKRGDESVEFIVYELPTFFYFSVFTVIVYLWLLVVITTNNFGNRRALNMKRPLIRHVFFALNIIMYAIFIVFIFLMAILPSYDNASPCFKGDYGSTTSKTADRIKISYWVVQLVISCTLALGFLLAALNLLRIVYGLRKRNLGRTNGSRTTEGSRTRSHGGTSRTDDSSIEMTGDGPSIDSGDDHHAHRRRHSPASPRTAAGIQMIIITVVAVTCVVFLIIRASIFLYYAYLGGGLPVMLFCMLEVIPQAMLVFYLHPFRCFREAGRSSTTSKGSRSGINTTYHTSTAGTATSNRVSKGSKASKGSS